jgi:hypothetical protein
MFGMSSPVTSFHIAGKLFGNKEMRLLMLGLDAAGKTSALPCSLVSDARSKTPPSYSIQTQVEPVRDYDTNGFVV